MAQPQLNNFDSKNIGLDLTFAKTLFVTDSEGNILLSNEFTAFTMGMSLEEVQKSNVADLVEKGVYNFSTTLEAIKQKKTISKIITTRTGFQVLSISTPLIDENGEVYLVVTTSEKEQIDYDFIEDKILRKRKVESNSFEKSIRQYGIIAESKQMRDIINVCNQIAPNDCKVILYGESGTGKDVLSNYIHKKSRRADKPFISVNCAAIPENLFESELFGYEKGSFTGAVSTKQGLLEMANGGTLFLDEIGEMPLDIQAKLLRVLENFEVRRIGGTKSFNVDFRLIAATNKNLEEMVEQGKFREDLFYRLNVVPIIIPPLRKRKQDIIGLTKKFLQDFNKFYNKDYCMNADEVNYLLNHSWPGNIRELKNYIERKVVMQGTLIEEKNDADRDLVDLDAIVNLKANANDKLPTLKEFVKEAEKRYIYMVLDKCNGKKGAAAEKLGIYRTVLYRKLKSFEESNSEIL